MEDLPALCFYFFFGFCGIALSGAFARESAFPLEHRLPEQILDLPVHAAQFRGGPGLHLRPKLRINSQKKRFSAFHHLNPD